MSRHVFGHFLVRSFRPAFAGGALLFLAPGPAAAGAEKVVFNRDVRPILSRHCFACHGPDAKKREAKLRLDRREDAVAAEAFVPGDAGASELIARLFSDDPDEVMPPPDKGEPLSDAQKAALKAWIEQGAEYQPHWAFLAPEMPRVPGLAAGAGEGDDADFPVRGPVDAFVLTKLRENGLRPAAPATRESWLRRVTIDLTGLPPTLAEIDAFLADHAPGAHERVVDRLLDSGAYGERMANDWLDVARYGDTYGRHEDFNCVVWPYRDWVIEAFNRNLPYDRFAILQTAGDLLPGAGQAEIVPTAFNRIHMQMNEAGSDPEEFRCENVADRVVTNAHAFLGLTMECCRCHDHKYDPLTTRDFYSLAAFFDNIDELGLYCRFTNAVTPPSVFVLSAEQRRAVEANAAELTKKLAEREAARPGAEARFHAWLKSNHPPVARPEHSALEGFLTMVGKPRAPHAMPGPVDAFSFDEIHDKRLIPNTARPDAVAESYKNIHPIAGPKGLGKALLFEDGRDNAIHLKGAAIFDRTDAFTLAAWVRLDGDLDEGPIVHYSRSALEAAHRGYELTVERNRVVLKLAHFWPGNAIAIRTREPLEVGRWTHVAGTCDGSSQAAGLRLYLDGKAADSEVLRDLLYRDIGYVREWGDFDTEQVADADVVPELHPALAGRINSKSFRNGALDEVRLYDRDLSAPEVAIVAGLDEKARDAAWLDWYLREIDEPWRALTAEIKALRETENRLSTEATEMMAMREMETPRQTFVLTRGRFDDRGEEVSPATPGSLPPLPEAYPRNRLGFAKWLTDGSNPLTARVEVNRLWQLFFGRGLVGTPEDFGTQGELPTHPELLDWLALHFQNETGWDIKALCREIVLSSTYRQATLPRDPAIPREDPQNRLLAHGPRLRLTAEQLRDQALSVAGILGRTIGGPSVKPYQPAGIWEEGGTQHTYRRDRGEALFRRSLYTFWRRTMPPPSMQVFDAPSREFCQLRRNETANPLQALTVLNDPQYVEAARLLAERLVAEYPAPDADGDAARIARAFRLLTARAPRAGEADILTAILADARAEFAANPGGARQLVHETGEAPVDESLPPAEVAATAMMVRALFGYEEVLCKL
ncbi:MAG: DUF1553 domain-containing protein [Akkermansiaceae bacterium]|nr:DUF1553 domain-containing protein [Akkermansiaceae bacterium]MCP5551740.1 DUF1553 domain-containing protein [Akkermansiaceae bacterium]